MGGFEASNRHRSNDVTCNSLCIYVIQLNQNSNEIKPGIFGQPKFDIRRCRLSMPRIPTYLSDAAFPSYRDRVSGIEKILGGTELCLAYKYSFCDNWAKMVV